MNGFYSYQTPHPASFSYTWRLGGTLISDFPEVAEDTYLLSQALAAVPLEMSVAVNQHHDIQNIVGSGAELLWCLTWYSDGRLGGTYLRGLIDRKDVGPNPASVVLHGVISPGQVGRTVTITASLVLKRTGSIAMDTSLPFEPGLILARHSRTLALAGAVPELSVDLIEFRSEKGLPSEIPYLVDLAWMPRDPEEMLEPGAIRLLVNQGNPFANALEGKGELASFGRSVLGQAMLTALLDNMIMNPELPNAWPEAPPLPGSIGIVWRSALRSVVPDGSVGELRELHRADPLEFSRRLMAATWNSEST